MLNNLSHRLFCQAWQSLSQKQELYQLTQCQAFRDFLEYLLGLYAASVTASQNEKNSDEMRLRAIENIKTLESLLSFFENYKEE